MNCVDACRDTWTIKDGRFAGNVMQTGHAWVALQWGRFLHLEDYREALQLSILCNSYGLSQCTAARMLHFVTGMYERGVISTKDTGGLVLKKGDFDCYTRLLEKIINRKDIGDIMAEGWYPLSERVGVDAGGDPQDGYCIMKGIDTLADPRFQTFGPAIGMPELTTAKALHVHGPTHFPAGPDIHRESNWPTYARSLNDVRILYSERYACTRDEIESMFTKEGFNIGKLEKHTEVNRAGYNSMGICDSGHHTWEPMASLPVLAEFYSALTGIDISARQLKQTGERASNMEKLLNVREGFTRKDDDVRGVILNNLETPIKIPYFGRYPGEHCLLNWFGRSMSRDDVEKCLDDYYTESGWDVGKGIPTEQKLAELGLEEFTGVVEPLLNPG